MRKGIIILYYSISLLILTGFFFHESKEPVIFSYSFGYFLALIFASIIAFTIPFILIWFVKKYSFKYLCFALVPSLILLLSIYIFFHFKHYASQKHLFDPYLQMPMQSLDLRSIDTSGVTILALGGSTTENKYLALEDKYLSIVKKQLSYQYPELNFTIINGGRDWYTSKHSLINYTSFYRQLNPDIVIVMHAINDIYRSFSPPSLSIGTYQSDYSHYYGPSIQAAQPTTFEMQIIRTIGSNWFSKWRKKKAIDIALKDYPSTSSYSYYMNTLVDYIQKDSASCFIVEQPSLYKTEMKEEELKALWFGKYLCYQKDNTYPSEISLMHAMTHFNSISKKISVEKQAFYVITKEYIPADLDHFTDDVHYTKKGAHALGKTVADQIINSGVIFVNYFQKINIKNSNLYSSGRITIGCSLLEGSISNSCL